MIVVPRRENELNRSAGLRMASLNEHDSSKELYGTDVPFASSRCNCRWQKKGVSGASEGSLTASSGWWQDGFSFSNGPEIFILVTCTVVNSGYHFT